MKAICFSFIYVFTFIILCKFIVTIVYYSIRPRKRLPKNELRQRISFYGLISFFVFACVWCDAHFRLRCDNDPPTTPICM